MSRWITLCELMFFLTGAAAVSGCGTMKNGQAWGQDAWSSLSWKKTGYAAYDAFMDLQTLIPAAGALVFRINDFDEETSDWATREHPVFGSGDTAGTYSDIGQGLLIAESVGTALLAPSGDENDDWIKNKAKGMSVEIAASGLVGGVTLLLKETTDRSRPTEPGHSSFPSGHTSASFTGATLSNNNLNCIPMNSHVRRSVQGFNLLFASTVGWARIEAGEHYPSDVLAGAAIGHFLSRFVYQAFSGLPEESNFGLVIVPLKRKGVVSGLTFRF